MSKGPGRAVYLTPKEAIERFPQLVVTHGIDARILGILLKHHILWGHYNTSDNVAMIQEDSLLYFIDFLNSLLARQHIPKDK